VELIKISGTKYESPPAELGSGVEFGPYALQARRKAMKHLKVLGLAMVVGAALMAIVGVSSASALENSTLCKTNTATCPAAEQYGAGTVISGATASGANATLTTKTWSIQCASTVLGATSGSATVTEGPVAGSITSLGWSGCTVIGSSPVQNCTVSSVNLPYNAGVQTEGLQGSGSLTAAAHSGGGNPGATLVCGEMLNCTYTTASAKLAGTGGAAGTANVVASKIALTGSGSKCPAGATWSAKYVLSSPSTVWVEM
jgi:hypothetical protein